MSLCEQTNVVERFVSCVVSTFTQIRTICGKPEFASEKLKCLFFRLFVCLFVCLFFFRKHFLSQQMCTRKEGRVLGNTFLRQCLFVCGGVIKVLIVNVKDILPLAYSWPISGWYNAIQVWWAVAVQRLRHLTNQFSGIPHVTKKTQNNLK